MLQSSVQYGGVSERDTYLVGRDGQYRICPRHSSWWIGALKGLCAVEGETSVSLTSMEICRLGSGSATESEVVIALSVRKQVVDFMLLYCF